ncbi:hypothetical protein KEM55_004838, partial [Ascosphaera atra]
EDQPRAVPAPAEPLRLRQELSLEGRRKILKAEAKELGMLLRDEGPYANHEERMLLLLEVTPALVRVPPEADLANEDFWDNALHRQISATGLLATHLERLAEQAKQQTVEDIMEDARQLAQAARWLWDEARFRIGEEARYQYATERGLLVPGPPASPPPVQETPSPSPNPRSLRRSSRARRQHQEKAQELAEQAQEVTEEAQPEDGREGEEEEAIQEADHPQVPAGQVSQEEREEGQEEEEEGSASSSSFALSSPPESVADPEEEQALEGLAAGPGVTPEPLASPGSPYSNLSPSMATGEEEPAPSNLSEAVADAPEPEEPVPVPPEESDDTVDISFAPVDPDWVPPCCRPADTVPEPLLPSMPDFRVAPRVPRRTGDAVHQGPPKKKLHYTTDQLDDGLYSPWHPLRAPPQEAGQAAPEEPEEEEEEEPVPEPDPRLEVPDCPGKGKKRATRARQCEFKRVADAQEVVAAGSRLPQLVDRELYEEVASGDAPASKVADMLKELYEGEEEPGLGPDDLAQRAGAPGLTDRQLADVLGENCGVAPEADKPVTNRERERLKAGGRSLKSRRRG